MELIVRSIIVRDNFSEEFLAAFARMVIAFGRLEHTIKITIKTLRVALKLSPDFMHGIAEAERKKLFTLMLDDIAYLHRQKFGECDEGRELEQWIHIAKKLAIARGKVVHGLLTIDDNAKPVVRHMRLRGKTLDFTEMSVSVAGLTALEKRIEALTRSLHQKQREWEADIA